MCMQDEPPYDTPAVTKPRTYVLAGDARRVEEPKPSIALAVIGTMLESEEGIRRGSPSYQRGIVDALRAARDLIAKAGG